MEMAVKCGSSISWVFHVTNLTYANKRSIL